MHPFNCHTDARCTSTNNTNITLYRRAVIHLSCINVHTIKVFMKMRILVLVQTTELLLSFGCFQFAASSRKLLTCTFSDFVELFVNGQWLNRELNNRMIACPCSLPIAYCLLLIVYAHINFPSMKEEHIDVPLLQKESSHQQLQFYLFQNPVSLFYSL